MTLHIGTVIPYEFEGYLVFGISNKIQSKLGVLSFDVSISNGKLCIVSKNTIQ